MADALFVAGAGDAMVPGDPTVALRLQATAAATITAPPIRRREFLEVMSARCWEVRGRQNIAQRRRNVEGKAAEPCRAIGATVG
jgi:hypothetical protein